MSNEPTPQENDIIFYTTPDGQVNIEVFFLGETFWLNQKKMSDLFGVDVRTISEQLQNIFKTNELEENTVIRKIRTTAADGKNYITNFTISLPKKYKPLKAPLSEKEKTLKH